MPARLPPAEKLSLTVRKNVRDAFESKLPEFTEELSSILGTPWTIEVDPRAIHPYAEPGGWGDQSLGGCLAEYIKDALWHVRNFPTTLKDEGIKELNSLAHAHVLSIDMDDHDPARFDSCGAEIRDGKLFIIIAPGRLGANSGESLKGSHMEKAMNEAPPPPGSDASQLSYSVRKGISSDYDKEIDEVKTDIQAHVQREDIAFVPNFEDTVAKLKAERAKPNPKMNYPDNWEEFVGSFTKLYFQGVADGLRRNGFADDEMLREGFNEAVESGKIAFRLVDELSYNSDCEVVIEKGVLYVQTTTEQWGSNITDSARKIVDQL